MGNLHELEIGVVESTTVEVERSTSPDFGAPIGTDEK